MARAAAKRRQPTHHHDDRRKHKDSGGQRFEDTLFFNRLRKNAKWVFVFLAVVFAGGFVVFGVGSSNLGLGDILNNNGGGGSGQPSVSKALKETQKDAKSPKAWRDLATAYDTQGDIPNAISAWTTYTSLRPKDVSAYDSLATDYQQQFTTQTNEAAALQAAAQSTQSTNFGPPTSSPLGRALSSVPDPISQQSSDAANQAFTTALQTRAATAQQLEQTYQQIVKLRKPAEPSDSFLLAQAAQNAGDTATAIAAYKRFVQLAPDDPNASYAKQQIKTLGSQPQG
jgi:regulator of sirC expression with transglutaminase-like and TPR domain